MKKEKKSSRFLICRSRAFLDLYVFYDISSVRDLERLLPRYELRPN